MGVTLVWREPPDRDANNYGREIDLRSGRTRSTGYLACSDRVGPGVLVLGSELDQDLRDLADSLCDAGFTALVPDLSVPDPSAIAVAGGQHLLDNWHPRLGVLALAGASDLARSLAQDVPVDAVAAVDDAVELEGLDEPVLVSTEFEEVVDFLLYHAS